MIFFELLNPETVHLYAKIKRRVPVQGTTGASSMSVETAAYAPPALEDLTHWEVLPEELHTRTRIRRA